MRIKTRFVVLDTQSISKNINNRCDTQQKTWAASGGSRGNGAAEGGGGWWWTGRRGGREGKTVNRGTIGENAIRNSTSLARQTPTPRAVPALDHPSQFQPPYSLAAPSPKFPSRRERPSRLSSMNFEFVANHFFAQLFHNIST